MFKKILIFSFILFLSGAFFYWKTGKIPNFLTNSNISLQIKSEYEKQGYQVDLIEYKSTSFGEPSLIVLANDKLYEKQCSLEKNKNLKSPVIAIYEHRTNPFFKALFFINPYKKIKEYDFSLKNINDLWIYDKKKIDLDNDLDNEMIVKILSSICGSGAELYQLVFDNMGEGIILSEGLPIVKYPKGCSQEVCNDAKGVAEYMKKNNLNEKDLENFNVGNLLIENKDTYSTNTDSFVEIYDIDNFDGPELIYAHLEWEEKECHFCPHYWVIGIYKYKNGKFIVDNKWNNGLLYKTKDKISLTDAHGYIEYPNNVFGFISQYYIFDERFPSSNSFLERKEPMLFKIVKENYNKN